MPTTLLSHPAVDAVLATAAELLGMEVVFIGTFDAEGFAFARVLGSGLGVADGDRLDRADSFCARMLAGAPARTTEATTDPHYADSPIAAQLRVCSYVGVPVRSADGSVVATLCGADRRCMPVSEDAVAVLRHLADVLGAHLRAPVDAGTVIRRTPTGWRVSEPAGPAATGGATAADVRADLATSDLISAMVLADLLAGDVSVPPRPSRPDSGRDEVDRLRLSVTQLEHALASRVVVEQAIGVLSERQHTSPRNAFERLRRVARARGRRVHHLAREVVGSASDGKIPLPPELAGPR